MRIVTKRPVSARIDSHEPAPRPGGGHVEPAWRWARGLVRLVAGVAVAAVVGPLVHAALGFVSFKLVAPLALAALALALLARAVGRTIRELGRISRGGWQD